MDIPEGWHQEGNCIHRTYPTGRFLRGLAFVTAVAEAAEAGMHHPDILFTVPTVKITLCTHDVDQVTDKDIAMAKTIDAIWTERFTAG